ncbi:MAG: S-adenosyl-l-methionine hydroxide adenosyltransferase family protein [Desulfonatronovibrionaceae bacterium]
MSRQEIPPPILFLTDFGLNDPYVGQMKAAVLRAFPRARMLDLTHGVQPFNTRQAGFFLYSSLTHAPEESVFTCVVDPGVGSNRRIVLLRIKNRWVLAPDNGLVSLTLTRTKAQECLQIKTPPGISSTFHGRDIFAPAAAELAAGTDPASLGTALDPGTLVIDADISPKVKDKEIDCLVLHVDRFGNAVLNLPNSGREADTIRAADWALQDCSISAVRYYQQLGPGQTGILAGSQGFLELAMNRDSAASRFKLACGQKIRLVCRQ